MQVPVRLVGIWDLRCLASAGRRRARGDVLIQTMRLVGVVSKFVMNYFLVANTLARGLATKAFVAAVRSWSSRNASVAKSRKNCHALSEKTSRRVNWMGRRGWAHSTAEPNVDGHTIAESQAIFAKINAMSRTQSHHIVRSHQMLSHTARVERLQSRLYSPNLERTVQHGYHIVKRSVRSC